MKITRNVIQACCGTTSLIFKADGPLTIDFIKFLVNNGFAELKNFTEAGILYATNSYLIVTGPLGSDKLQVKCRKANCDQQFNDFEVLLTNY